MKTLKDLSNDDYIKIIIAYKFNLSQILKQIEILLINEDREKFYSILKNINIDDYDSTEESIIKLKKLFNS